VRELIWFLAIALPTAERIPAQNAFTAWVSTICILGAPMQENVIPESVVKQAFYDSTEKAHVITCWVGLLLNLIWFTSDYFIMPAYFVPFLIFRLAVSAAGVFALVFRRKLGLDIYMCMFVLVLGISVQNAYMWSVMDLAHFEQHAFAYIVLFIGVGMLVLWEFRISLLLIAATIVSNIVFYRMNSRLTVEEFIINGGLLTLTVLLFCVFLIRSRYRLTYNEIKSRLALEQSKQQLETKNFQLVSQKVEIENQNLALESKNREITDSIHYAKNIQNASIPSEERFRSHFADSFVLYKPKDIVSGDFYWVYERDEIVYYVTADCTGHGVPGGFMTMLGLSFLEEIVAGRNIQDPAAVLDLLRDKIINALNQSGDPGESKDGMDITICRIDKRTRELTYASANNDLYVVSTDPDSNTRVLNEYKANRQPCGFYHDHKPFTAHTIRLQAGDCIYTFTDGYADQFGGPKGKKFRYKQLEELLAANAHLGFDEQKHLLNDTIENWRGSLEQIDDILVIGVKI
jgi:phosphoserine phosphatase RsbU/P